MNTKFDELMQNHEFQKAYAIEGLIECASELIWQLLVRRGMKQADLAHRLNKTPAFVSQLLTGEKNMTVRTLAEVVYTLGATVKIEAVDREHLICENHDPQGEHTFRVPITSLKPSLHAVFSYEGRKASGQDFPASDTGLRSGFAA